MSTPARVATAAVIGVLVIGGAFFMLGRPGSSSVGAPGASPAPTASPSPSSSPTTLHQGLLDGGHLRGRLIARVPLHVHHPRRLGRSDPSIRSGYPEPNNSAPAGAGLIFAEGGRLASNPCGGQFDIPVGPTVDDFANALAEHPTLGVTKPVDVTIDGYTGKFVEFTPPADISACQEAFFPWDSSLYVQGPSQGWHLWILDVEGTRVVVQTNDYPGTSAKHLAELQAIVDSIQIEP